MENLVIRTEKETPFIPNVTFDYSSGVCTLDGESFMDDAYEFYSPLLDWIRQYRKLNKSVLFEVKLSYFNTSSSRLILEILDLLKEYADEGGNVNVEWYCLETDVDMKEEIEDFEYESGLNINIKEIAN